MDGGGKRGAEAYKRYSKKNSDGGWLSLIAETGSGRENEPDSRGTAAPREFLKKTEAAPGPAREPPVDSKYRRVAKFLILIGSERAAGVLANLDEGQVEEVSREIALVRGIDAVEAERILKEFEALLSGGGSYGGGSKGGAEEARRILYAAFGPEKGEALLRRSVPRLDESIFSFLEDFSGERIMNLLHDESPATGAVILSRLKPSLSAAALSAAGTEWRAEAIRRIAKLGSVSPEVVLKLAEGLREKARRIASPVTTNFDGAGTLAAILKHADVSFGDKLLDEIAESDFDLSGSVKEKLFTLDDVARANDKPIQEKLHSMNNRDIAILVRGRPEAFAEKILSNISANRRAEVRLEDGLLDPLQKRDSEEAMRSFMDWFRSAREEGTILFLGDEFVE